MKLLVIALSLLGFSGIAQAAENECYQLSRTGQSWSRTPEELCVREVGKGQNYQLTLEYGFGQERQVLATYNFILKSRARCLDCNADVFGAKVAENSVFADFTIAFDGSVHRESGFERGLVKIGARTLYYQSR